MVIYCRLPLPKKKLLRLFQKVDRGEELGAVEREALDAEEGGLFKQPQESVAVLAQN